MKHIRLPHLFAGFPVLKTSILAVSAACILLSQSCSPRPEEVTPPPPGITMEQYMTLSRDWSALYRSTPADSLYHIVEIDSTVGGRFSYEEIQALARTAPADGYIYFRFAKDPETKKISVMLKGIDATGQPLIYRNSGENFCPLMCD